MEPLVPVIPHRHVPALDGVRGLAIVLVLIYHLPWTRAPRGLYGVDVFFTLSGFLITSILVAEYQTTGRVSFRRFYWRRALRLLPALFSILAALWLGVLLFGQYFRTDPALMGRATLYALAYVSNWVNALQLGSWPSVMGHFWSLAVEEQFYLLWPAICLCALTRVPLRTVGAIALGIAFASLALRSALWIHTHDWARVYFATDTRADALLVGCALACLPLTVPRTVAWCGLAVILGLSLTRGATDWPTSDMTWHHTLIALATAAIISGVRRGGSLAQAFASAPLRWLGKRSYALYLWHVPVLFAATRALPAHPIAAAAAGIAASLAITAVSWHVIEAPALALKDVPSSEWRWRYRFLA